MTKIKNEININLKILFLFFFLVLLFRFFFVFISHGDFPVEFSWHYLFTINKFKQNDFTSLIQHDENAQFQFFTDFLALIFFKLAGNVWHARLNTSIIQIIPSVYITIIFFILFYKKNVPIFIAVLIFIFSISFASLNNIKHFTESHFYFQTFFFVAGLLIFKKHKIAPKDFMFLILVLVSSSLNMEKASFINYLSFLTILLVRFFFEKNKLFLKFFFILLIFTVLMYIFILSLNVPTFAPDPNYIFSYSKFVKTNIKILLHENSVFFLLFLFIFLFILKTKYNKKFYQLNRSFIFILIWCFIFTLSASFSRGGVYDRYKDFIQIYGFLTFYILLNLNNSNLNRKLFFFLKTIAIICCIFLFSKNLVKIIQFYNFSKKNDETILYIVKDYRDNGNHYLNDVNLKLFGDLHRFRDNIRIALDNKLINFDK